MSFKATVRTSKSTLSTIDPKSVNRVLGRTGVQTINHIRQRTERGLDINDRSFEPYAKSTLKQKAKVGSSTRVNLKGSSEMLRSMTSKRIKDGVQVFLSDRQGVGSYHQYGSGRLPKRQWFGLNRVTENNIIKEVLNALRLSFSGKLNNK